MPEDKSQLPVRCPDVNCQQLNLLVRDDFHGKHQITFKCSKCGLEISFNNPDQVV